MVFSFWSSSYWHPSFVYTWSADVYLNKRQCVRNTWRQFIFMFPLIYFMTARAFACQECDLFCVIPATLVPDFTIRRPESDTTTNRGSHTLSGIIDMCCTGVNLVARRILFQVSLTVCENDGLQPDADYYSKSCWWHPVGGRGLFAQLRPPRTKVLVISSQSERLPRRRSSTVSSLRRNANEYLTRWREQGGPSNILFDKPDCSRITANVRNTGEVHCLS